MLSAILSFGIHFRLQAQNYPVTGNVQVKAPYSVYLSDYTKLEEDKLIINLKLNDPVDPVRDVKLRIRLESQTVTLETSPSFHPGPITLNNGFMEKITGADITDYFFANNLQFTKGLTKQEFQRKGALPEGFYKVCVEVLDYISGNTISLPICTQAWIILNDPPRLLLPENNKIVKANDPQNLPFRWMPMNSGSPNSFFTTEYHFALYEVWPATRNPNDAVNTTPSIFETTISTPAYFYSISDPPLVPGRKYAWRVQAKDAGGMDMFKNQGYSEVFSFIWGQECNVPLNITSEVLSSDRAKAVWEEGENATGYVIRYREKGSSGLWYEVKSSSNNGFMTGTKGETEYEYQVRCDCGGIGSLFSPLNYFKTPKASDYVQNLNCNDKNKPPVIENKNPLPSAKKGDEWTIGLFTVTLTEVTGANGIYSGKCRVNVALINAEVTGEFTNAKVNTDKQVFDGVFVIKSIGGSLIPPDLRDKIKNQLTEVDKYMNQLEKYAPTADEGLKISREVLGKIDDILKDVKDALTRDSIEGKNPGGGWHLQIQLGSFKNMIKDGFGWIQKGDTAKGKNLLAQGLNGIKDLLGAGGDALSNLGSAIVEGSDKLKEVIVKLLNEIKSENSPDSIRVKRDKLKELSARRKKAIEDLNSNNKNIVVGDYSNESMSEPEFIGDPIMVSYSEAEKKELLKDPNYKIIYDNRLKIADLYSKLQRNLWLIALSNDLLNNEDKLKELINEVRGNVIKEELKTLGMSLIEDLIKGKNPQVEDKIRTFLKNKLDTLMSELNK